jgi:hypothetical protein
MNEKQHDTQESKISHSQPAKLPVKEFSQMETHYKQDRRRSKEIEVERHFRRSHPRT